jgi:hypothetical protein
VEKASPKPEAREHQTPRVARIAETLNGGREGDEAHERQTVAARREQNKHKGRTQSSTD